MLAGSQSFLAALIPVCTFFEMLGFSSVPAIAGEQFGYSIADVIAETFFGLLI